MHSLNLLVLNLHHDEFMKVELRVCNHYNLEPVIVLFVISAFFFFIFDFNAPDLKGLLGASSVWILCLSVHQSVCPFVRPLFRPAYVQSAIFKVWVVTQQPNLDCKFI